MPNAAKSLKSWMPRHFTEGTYEPVIDAIGASLDDLESVILDTIRNTYISRANGVSEVLPTYRDASWLDVHGLERCIGRLNYDDTVETNEDYANRVQRLKYNRTKANIEANVTSISGITDLSIIDDFEANPSNNLNDLLFDATSASDLTVTVNEESYGNYGPLDFTKRHNCFSVLIERPIRQPLAFYDNEQFFDSEAFFDTRTQDLDDRLINVTLTLITQKIPAGAGYRLLVKDFAGRSVGDLANQQNELNKRFGDC